jgi:hypothetical protein
MRDMHQSNSFSMSFPSPGMNLRFKSSLSSTGAHSNLHSLQSEDKSIFDRPLVMLRKVAELKRLQNEILSMTGSREPYNRFNGYPSGARNASSSLPQPKIEDLVVIGYNGYVCRDCLIAHPLSIYKDKSNTTLNLIQTRHRCYMERLMEIPAQILDKEHVLSDLYENQLPAEMLGAVRRWTNNQCTLNAIEISTLTDGFSLIAVSNRKQWITRAINERVTHLTDNELKDFISTARNRTYALLKIQDDEINQNSSKVFFASLASGRQ